MTPIARKGVLLRLTPDLLDRIDVAAGAMNRTAWITAVIIARLEAIAEADATLYTEEHGEPAPVVVWEDEAMPGWAAVANDAATAAEIHFAVDEEVGTPAERDAYVQGASDALAIIDDDGIELGLVAVYRQDGVLEIGHAGGLFSDTTSPQGSSSEAVRTDGGGDWGGATPRESADSEELAETVPPFDTSPEGEPADQGYSLPVGPGERGEGSDPALTSSSSPPEQGPREPGSAVEGESAKGSDTARDADTPRDTDSPNPSTSGVGWPD